MAGLSIGVPFEGLLKGISNEGSIIDTKSMSKLLAQQMGGILKPTMNQLADSIERSIEKSVVKPTKGGIGGMLGGLLGGDIKSLSSIGKIIPIAGAMLGALGIIVASSKMLQSTLGVISKLIMLIVKPIGDIFAVALMPLLYILKPVGQFFNMLMKPYIQKAMAAMRAGGQYIQAGKPEDALKMFILGIQYLFEPIIDALASAFPALGGVSDAYMKFLDETLVKGTLDATILATKDWDKLFVNLEKARDYLQTLNLHTSVSDELSKLKLSLDDASTNMTDMSDDVYDIFEAIAKYVSPEEKWAGKMDEYWTTAMDLMKTKLEQAKDDFVRISGLMGDASAAALKKVEDTLATLPNLIEAWGNKRLGIFQEKVSQMGQYERLGYEPTVTGLGEKETMERIANSLEMINDNTNKTADNTSNTNKTFDARQSTMYGLEGVVVI